MSNKIIKPEQLRFVKGNRTSDNLLTLHSLFDLYCNKSGKKLYTEFIDFEKAYDKVSQTIMLKKLHSVCITRLLCFLDRLHYLCIAKGHNY